MRRHTGLVAVALAGAAAMLWLPRPVEQDAARPAASPPAARTAKPASAPQPLARVARDDAPDSAEDRRVQAFRERSEFQERVRAFFAQAATLTPAEREQQAQRIDAEITRYENARELSAAEALSLRLGLIRETSVGARQQELMEQMIEAYQTRSAQKLAAHASNADPMFELYKAREQEIVARVQSLQSIPDGLTREEYLRRELQREREQLFGANQ